MAQQATAAASSKGASARGSEAKKEKSLPAALAGGVSGLISRCAHHRQPRGSAGALGRGAGPTVQPHPHRARSPRSALLQPFDVVKTRLQVVQRAAGAGGAPALQRCAAPAPSCPDQRGAVAGSAQHARRGWLQASARRPVLDRVCDDGDSRPVGRGVLSLTRALVRREGVSALWSGVGPACIRVGGGAGAFTHTAAAPLRPTQRAAARVARALWSAARSLTVDVGAPAQLSTSAA